jgi:hypothetical protein
VNQLKRSIEQSRDSRVRTEQVSTKDVRHVLRRSRTAGCECSIALTDGTGQDVVPGAETRVRSFVGIAVLIALGAGVVFAAQFPPPRWAYGEGERGRSLADNGKAWRVIEQYPFVSTLRGQ